ncbi:fish-egg lectin-like [Scyliorhinus canicula]|uniref:fish-egg lectin-like n=1 Tax=Scyliorhinus canicula TaxID=7830 RepID=UPI0018F763EF|nr:fish-egg lectin-like [Scyliorhinus canicula]
MRVCIFLLLLCAGASWALVCRQVAGRMKQIDASNGQVFAVDLRGNVFTRRGEFWARVPGNLGHVTVGAAGVWGVGRDQKLYRLVEGSWAILAGLLMQVDAGGDQIVAGVDRGKNIFCCNKQAAVTAASYFTPAYTRIPGKMRYYSCGPGTCWGISAAGNIYCRLKVKPVSCAGSKWLRVPGRFRMVEVGTDGTVYAINYGGVVYRRVGISALKPQGVQWARIHFLGRKFRHVTADLGTLWLVEMNGNIIRCQ